MFVPERETQRIQTKPSQTESYLHQNVSIWELVGPTLTFNFTQTQQTQMSSKQYNNLDSYPKQYQQKECMNPNCLVDFQMDVAYPGKRSMKIVNGPGAQQFGQSDRNYISEEITKRWINCAPELANQLPVGYGYCDFWVCLFIVLSLCIIGICCLFPYYIYKGKKLAKIAIEWRDLFIQEMQDFIQNDLEKRYPNLVFTLIYPVCIYRTLVTVETENGGLVNQNQRPVASNVYCYIRVSNAPLPIGDSYEPMIYTTNNGNNNDGATRMLAVEIEAEK